MLLIPGDYTQSYGGIITLTAIVCVSVGLISQHHMKSGPRHLCLFSVLNACYGAIVK